MTQITASEVVIDYFNNNKEEVERPFLLYDKLDNRYKEEFQPNTIRKSLRKEARKENIGRIQFSNSKTYYGHLDAIENFEENLSPTSDNKSRIDRVINLIWNHEDEVFTNNEIIDKLDLHETFRFGRHYDRIKDIERMKVNNRYYYGTSKSIKNLKEVLENDQD